MGKERVINVKELISECLRKWWIILLSGLVLAALLAGYQYVQDRNALAASENLDLAEMRSQFTPEQQAAVDNVLTYRANLLQQQDYLNRSILMQIDPSKEGVYTLQYYIETGHVTNYAGITERDVVADLATAYAAYINTGKLAKEVHIPIYEGVDSKFIAELIRVTPNLGTADNAAFFTVSAIGVDEAACQALAESVKGLLTAYQPILSEKIGPHVLNLVNEGYSELVDNDLWNLRITKADTIQRIQGNITSLQNSMSEAQRQYLEASSAELESSMAEPEPVAGASINKRYLAVGFVGGAMLAAAAVLFLYLMKGTINSGEDIEHLYHIRMLGAITQGDTEQQLDLLMANLKAACDFEKSRQVYVTGSKLSALDPNVVAELKSRSHQLGIPLLFGESFLDQAWALGKMMESDAVILMEKERVSRYDDLAKEYKTCMEYNKKILGLIIFR